MNTLALDRLGDEIAELSAHLEAATARLLDLIREFDARAGWNTGFRSCAAWLSWRVGLDPGAARERVRVARALGVLPLLARALARGELSYAKIRALTRIATPETEERLLRIGRAGTAEHVERIVRGWRRVDRKTETAEASHSRPARTGGRCRSHAGALRGTRSLVSRRSSEQRGRFRGNADDGTAASRRAGPTRGVRPAPRHRPGSACREVSGRRPCRRERLAGSERGRPVGTRRRHTRFRGNGPAACL